MIKSRHTLSYCEQCETYMVICADCGNNCCNAMTGNIDGNPCGCKEAYDHQSKYHIDNNSVVFKKSRK